MSRTRDALRVRHAHMLSKKQIHELLEEGKMYMTGSNLVKPDWGRASECFRRVMDDSGDIDIRAEVLLNWHFLPPMDRMWLGPGIYDGNPRGKRLDNPSSALTLNLEEPQASAMLIQALITHQLLPLVEIYTAKHDKDKDGKFALERLVKTYMRCMGHDNDDDVAARLRASEHDRSDGAALHQVFELVAYILHRFVEEFEVHINRGQLHPQNFPSVETCTETLDVIVMWLCLHRVHMQYRGREATIWAMWDKLGGCFAYLASKVSTSRPGLLMMLPTSKPSRNLAHTLKLVGSRWKTMSDHNSVPPEQQVLWYEWVQHGNQVANVLHLYNSAADNNHRCLWRAAFPGLVQHFRNLTTIPSFMWLRVALFRQDDDNNNDGSTDIFAPLTEHFYEMIRHEHGNSAIAYIDKLLEVPLPCVLDNDTSGRIMCRNTILCLSVSVTPFLLLLFLSPPCCCCCFSQ